MSTAIPARPRGARFVSKYGKYRFVVRPEKTSRNFDGDAIVTARGLMAVFGRDGRTNDDVILGISSFTHTGLGEDRDTEEHASPAQRISVFDSLAAQDLYNWTDEEREEVEEALRNSELNGVSFLEVRSAPAQKPWPAYDETLPERIVDIARATGTVEQTIKYELENLARAGIINELQEVEEDSIAVLDAS